MLTLVAIATIGCILWIINFFYQEFTSETYDFYKAPTGDYYSSYNDEKIKEKENSPYTIHVGWGKKIGLINNYYYFKVDDYIIGQMKKEDFSSRKDIIERYNIELKRYKGKKNPFGI